jgi:hypothetical protein
MHIRKSSAEKPSDARVKSAKALCEKVGPYDKDMARVAEKWLLELIVVGTEGKLPPMFKTWKHWECRTTYL